MAGPWSGAIKQETDAKPTLVFDHVPSLPHSVKETSAGRSRRPKPCVELTNPHIPSSWPWPPWLQPLT